jgi:hypothetical protein
MARIIAEFVCEEGRVCTTAEIAKGVDKKPDDSTFERGLKAACEEDNARIKRVVRDEKVVRGKYEPTALGI